MQNKDVKHLFLAGVLVALLCSSSFAQQIAGIPRFGQVNPYLYRGGQPTETALEALAQLGIVTVLDLRAEGVRGMAEERTTKALGMHYISIPMRGLRAPSKEQIDRAMSVLQDTKNWPVFVHCHHGVDRTGTVIACYRIQFESWPNERAKKEAEGYGMHMVERGMKNFILNFHPATTTLAGTLSALSDGK
jgi:protein tyrosine/serine phosphatase